MFELKKIYIPPEKEEEKKQQYVPPVPPVEGKKFIGSGEDANAYV